MNKEPKKDATKILIKLAKEYYEQEHRSGLTSKELKTYKKYPHFFVIGCLMDRQIRANNAWSIPDTIAQQLGTPDIREWNIPSPKEIVSLFPES